MRAEPDGPGGKSAFAPFTHTLHAPGQLRPRLPEQCCARSLASMAPSQGRNLDLIPVVLMAAMMLFIDHTVCLHA